MLCFTTDSAAWMTQQARDTALELSHGENKPGTSWIPRFLVQSLNTLHRGGRPVTQAGSSAKVQNQKTTVGGKKVEQFYKPHQGKQLSRDPASI